MNKPEIYKNCGLEELMNYVKSITEVKTDISYEDSPNQVTPVNKHDNYQNRALEELMNYVNSLGENQTDVSWEANINQNTPVPKNIVEVQLTAVATEAPLANRCIPSPLQIIENEQIALSPSNLNNLLALIQDLHLSNRKLVKRVTYLSQAITEFHQDLESYKAQFHTASSKLGKQKQELEASYQTIQEQQSLMEKLSAELATSKELVAQCQAEYHEQSCHLSIEKDNCRDLRTRLNREQQHSLQLKVALEKCLEIPATSYKLADDSSAFKTTNLEESNSFAPKAPPIQPWTNQTRGGSNQIDLSWERQNNPEEDEIKDYASILEPEIPSPETLDLFSSSKTEDDLEIAIATLTKEETLAASPIATNPIDTYGKSPSPLVYPSRPPKGRKSFSAIELPSFIS